MALLSFRLALRAVGWRFRIWSLLVLVALPTFEGVAAQEDLRPAEGLRDKTPRVYALRGARIVAGPDELIDSGVVIVRDRFIEAVGKEIPIPPDAVVLDMAGKTIYPGFLDAYSEQAVTWSNDQGAPYWNAEIRPQLSVARLYRPETATDEARRRQGITARLVAPADGVLKGRSAVVSTGGWSGPRALLRADVALHARLTIPFGRGERGYPNSPMGAVALARQAMYDAQWYHAARDAAVRDRSSARPELNDALEVLTEYLHEGGLVIFDAPNELFCLRAAAFAREFSLRYALRGSGYEYRRLEAIAALKVPVIVPVDFPRPPPVATPEAALSVSLERMLHWDLAPENPARLVAAGVPIALTADGLEDLAAFWPAIRKAVRRGLPPREALRALTSTPAELLGVSDQLGTLAPRKLASMVITEGDLFTTEAKILETWVEGERFRWDSAIDVQGTWQMEIPVRDQRRSSTWIISGPRNRLAAEIRIALQQPEQPPTVVKATQVTLVGQRLTVVFPAGDLGYEGAARLSVLLAEPPGEKRTWTGHITWPDETRVPVQGVQIATTAPDTSPQEKQESKKTEPAPTVRALFEVNYPLGAYGRSGPPEQPQHVLFTNATIWTCGPQGVLRDASLLIGNGKILAVGKHLDIPPQAIVVDAQGMHITPGIIDCHSHMATDGGINESSQAITAEVRIADFLDCNDVAIYWQLAGGVTAANILHGSANPIGGQNQVIKLRWGALPDQLKFAEAPPGIKFALGENVKRSNVPTPPTRYPQSRMGVEQLLRDAFQAAREYQQLWQRWTQNPTGPPPRRDLELDALVEVLEGKRWIHCHSYRQDEILAFLRVLEDFHITAGSLQHILEGYKVAEVIARHGATASSFADWWAYKFEVYDAIPFNGALMHRAGIIVSFNSDDRELARHLNHEAAKAIKYGGLPAEEALKFVTLNPAKQLRIDAWVGSLEPGKHADFVLWSGPPLSTLSRCEQTWIDGRKYFDRQEDMQLRNRVQEMRAKLVQRILNSGETPDATVRNRRDDSSLWPRYDEFCPFHTHDHFDRQNQEETVQAP